MEVECESFVCHLLERLDQNSGNKSLHGLLQTLDLTVSLINNIPLKLRLSGFCQLNMCLGRLAEVGVQFPFNHSSKSREAAKALISKSWRRADNPLPPFLVLNVYILLSVKLTSTLIIKPLTLYTY